MIGRDNQARGTNKPELMLAESKESMLCWCFSTVYLLTLSKQAIERLDHEIGVRLVQEMHLRFYRGL